MQNLHRLRVWRAVVASGSVQQAARNLGNSPATVSQHIIALQREVAAPLYRRDGRGIAVTEAGHALAARSEALLAGAADLQTFVDRLAAGPATRLTLGSFSSATTVWLPDVLRAAQLRFPGLHMEILANEPAPPGERAFADIEVRAESGLADPVRMRGHDRDELLDDAYVVVTEADHPLAQAPEVRMAELAEHALVDLHVQGSPSGEVIDEAARAAGLDLRYAAGADDHHGVLAMVAAGMGVTVLPLLATLDLPAGLVVRPLLDPTPVRRIVLHVRQTMSALPHVVFLRREIGRVARAYAEDLAARGPQGTAI
ncbi:LysR family transcriptional regulator [Brevibacterium ihuae]|uniref:LysR family transcriptional regulator n=1 Tax=Brevibacterium ihuae TaxID=1631743 RepID=UPI0015E0ECB2|nr:LysR family transcriptional regulator [Brevibacterium ihuae]